MNFSEYMIVSDLDGTLFGRDGRPAQRNLEAIERFKAGGGLFTIATGRLHLNIRKALGDPALLINGPMICCNGGYLYDPVADSISDGDTIPAQDARDILAFIRTYCPNIAFRVSSPYNVRSETGEGIIAKDLATFNEGTVEISRPAEAWPMDDWFKIVMRGEGAELAEAKRAFEQVFGSRLKATSSGSRLWEVQSPHIHKALGIQKLKKACNGIGNDRILIACGDQENDLAMLQAADFAACPANAIDAVQAISHRVFCDCHEGMIADLIEAIEAGEFPKGAETV